MELERVRVAILVEELYQDQEVWYPYYRLKEAGATVIVVGTNKKEYKSKHGYPITANVMADKVSANDFDGLIIPGGYAPDILRRYPEVIQLVKQMDKQRKIIAAICHGGWVLCSTSSLRGKTVTGFFAIKDDLTNAGATYVDRDVVRDGHLITSRKPDDLPAFVRAFIEALQETPRPAPTKTQAASARRE